MLLLDPVPVDFGNVEIGTTSLSSSIRMANYGDTDLILSTAPSSVGDFNLVTSLSFPVTLSSYDSLTLEFNYTPTVAGSSSVIYDFTTNDPNFQGISLTGNSYQIVPAIEKIIYASSGLQNDGNIVTVNPVTGSGSMLGQSLFTEIKGLAINPLSGIIYGVASVAGSSVIVRVNSELGDSYSLFPVNIPSTADIAFDTLGNFYGIGVNGELYTIDLNTGFTTFLVDAIGSYSGITFHPQTNELWATSRSFTPPNKDAVFKVNISTGDTTIIGHTGLNKLTNDLVFDESLNLYGIIGSSSELNDFININPTNGVGNIIGSIGMKNILSLAYIISSPTSVEDENQTDLPTAYSLYQNYPNPFNPTTKIKFTIPSVITTGANQSQMVSLKVFDILGNEVEILVNEEKEPGTYEVEFSGEAGQASGVYFYLLRAGSFIQTKKMVFLK